LAQILEGLNPSNRQGLPVFLIHGEFNPAFRFSIKKELITQARLAFFDNQPVKVVVASF
jgi:hypothetical protein